jgi:hypothetical protein
MLAPWFALDLIRQQPLRRPDGRATEEVKFNEADASLVLSSGTYPDLRDPVVAETPRDGGGPSAPNDERVQRIESESHMHQGTALAGVPSPTQGRSTSPNWKSEQQTNQRPGGGQSDCLRK